MYIYICVCYVVDCTVHLCAIPYTSDSSAHTFNHSRSLFNNFYAYVCNIILSKTTWSIIILCITAAFICITAANCLQIKQGIHFNLWRHLVSAKQPWISCRENMGGAFQTSCVLQFSRDQSNFLKLMRIQ